MVSVMKSSSDDFSVMRPLYHSYQYFTRQLDVCDMLPVFDHLLAHFFESLLHFCHIDIFAPRLLALS